MMTSSPLVNQRLHQVEDGMLAAHRNHAFGGGIVGAKVPACDARKWPRAIPAYRPYWCISLKLSERAFTAACLMFSGVGKIRLARSEVHHIHALLAQAFGIGCHLHGGGDADGRDAFGDFGCGLHGFNYLLNRSTPMLCERNLDL